MTASLAFKIQDFIVGVFLALLLQVYHFLLTAESTDQLVEK